MRLKGKMHQIPHRELEMRPLWSPFHQNENHKELHKKPQNQP
jgi:hypothetical protein